MHTPSTTNYKDDKMDNMFYIDYLDHVTSGSREFEELKLRLRFDLLIFGKDQLCMSVPACIKLGDTTNLLMELDEFWNAGKIVLQLDKKHKGNPSNYFRNRKKVLARSMSEESLVNNFEFIAYENSRTDRFFNTYLSDVASVSSNKLYIGKEHDTDSLFRSFANDSFELHYDEVCCLLKPMERIQYTGITNKIQELANNPTHLFQRSIVENIIDEEYNPTDFEKNVVSVLLDRSFARANAETSNAKPLSLITNQLTGRWLYKLLKKSYRFLFENICNLSWDEIFYLSQDQDWQNFIEYINTYINTLQNVRKAGENKEFEYQIENYIDKLSNSLSLFVLLKQIHNEVIDEIKSEFITVGLVSEIQNLNLTIDLIENIHKGKYQYAIDVLLSIDMLANKIFNKLTKEKDLSYLIHDNDRSKRNYHILK